MRWRSVAGAMIFIVVLLAALGVAIDGEVDCNSVFWTIFTAKAALFFAVLVFSTLALWINAVLAFRFAQPRRPWLPAPISAWPAGGQTLRDSLLELFDRASPRYQRYGAAGVALFLGALIATEETSN